jgi:hypothetical protein
VFLSGRSGEVVDVSRTVVTDSGATVVVVVGCSGKEVVEVLVVV